MSYQNERDEVRRAGVAGKGAGGMWSWLGERAGEIAVGAWVWYGLHEFAHLRLPVVRWGGVLGGCVLVWILGAGLRVWRPARGWLWIGLEFAAVIGVLVGFTRALPFPVSAGQISYAGVCLSLAMAGWRGWVQWRSHREGGTWTEPVRVLAVGSAPLVALLPLFSDRLLGGTDARWYAYMLRDFIDEFRAGVFPVFIGQGEFAWNGGVHPFRSAPVYMHLAGLWDLLTGRTLNAPALQHLTALTAGLGGALGFYAAAAALLPMRRWIAAGWAVLYAVAPVWLGVLYCADAYMTFIAMAVLPAVLYGNARSLLGPDGRGYGWLAAGLGAVWMCHPPSAMMAMLLTVLLQGGSLLLGPVSSARWRAASAGAGLFGGMSLYYFAGMGELPRAPGMERADGLQVAGLLVALAGLGNGLLMGRSRAWREWGCRRSRRRRRGRRRLSLIQITART